MAEGEYHKYDADTWSYRHEVDALRAAVTARRADATFSDLTETYHNGGHESEVLKGTTVVFGGETHEVRFCLVTTLRCDRCEREVWADGDDAGQGRDCHCSGSMAETFENMRYNVELPDRCLIVSDCDELVVLLVACLGLAAGG